jgi:rhamnosyltransferase
MSKKVSVLIPLYNGDKTIRSLLTMLLNQKIDTDVSIEIIVVDSSSTDNTLEIITNEFPEVKVFCIPNKEFDHGGTRNYLASLASGDYLLYMTQDAIPFDKYLIKNLLNPFQDKDVLVSYARQIPKEDAHVLEKFARNFNYPSVDIIKSKDCLSNMGIKTFFNSNVCSIYKKETFVEYGMFPEKIILNEDMIFASNIILKGFKVAYIADAKVYHSHNYSLKQQFKRYFDIGMAFNETSYLLNYASNEKEGLKMVRKLINFLIDNKYIRIIPYMFLEVIFKFVGYKLGKIHHIIPLSLKRTLSAYMK